jgi:hypothetical protein
MNQTCYDVKCPTCGNIYFETTGDYSPDWMTTGAMLRFKKEFGPEGYNWSRPFSDYDMAEALICPACDGALAPNGHVRIGDPAGKRFAPEQTETVPIPSTHKKELPLKKKGKIHFKTHDTEEAERIVE